MADFEGIVKKHLGEDGSIPASAINAIVSAIKNAVGNEYVEKERYKAKLAEIDTLKEQTQTAEDNATTAEKWKDKYNALKSDFETYKQDQAKREEHATKETAYKELLRDAGIPERHMVKVLKYSDVDAVELDDKGKIKSAKDLLKEIKEEWSDHIEKTDKKGADTSTPPAGSGKTYSSKAEIYKIKDATERQKAIAENINLFTGEGE